MIDVIPDSPFPHNRRVPQISLWAYAPLAIAVGLRFTSESTANLSYLVLAVYALFGPVHAIRALALSWLFTMLNPGIAPEPSALSAGRYAVLLAAVCGIFIRNGLLKANMKLYQTTFWTLLLGIFLILHSIIFSPMVDVSILKALSWTLAMTSLLSAWSGLSSIEHKRTEIELFFFLILVALASLPFVTLPVGYLTNGKGFQGVLNQPQAFGVFAALLGAWALAQILGKNEPSWLLFGVVGISLGLILMSGTRTAGLAFVLSAVVSLLLISLFTGRPVKRVAPGLTSRRTRIMLSAIVIGGLILAPTIKETVEDFLIKSNGTDIEGIFEVYMRSRGVLIFPMLENISDRPLTGIGFGIASNPLNMEISRDPLFGFPTGAAVEKGVAPLMILEELGVLGMLLVLFWLLMIVYHSARARLPTFTVCLSILLLNMGEASLFSPGGMGLLTTILLAWAASYPKGESL